MNGTGLRGVIMGLSASGMGKANCAEVIRSIGFEVNPLANGSISRLLRRTTPCQYFRKRIIPTCGSFHQRLNAYYSDVQIKSPDHVKWEGMEAGEESSVSAAGPCLGPASQRFQNPPK